MGHAGKQTHHHHDWSLQMGLKHHRVEAGLSQVIFRHPRGIFDPSEQTGSVMHASYSSYPIHGSLNRFYFTFGVLQNI